MSFPPERRIFGPGRLLLPCLDQLGRHAGRSAAEVPLPAHAHRFAWEVCLVTRGAVDWWAGEELHRVRAGELYVTRPGEPHGGEGGLLHLADLSWVQVRLSGARRLQGLPRPEADALHAGFAGLRRRRFPAPPAAAEAFAALHAEHDRPGPWSASAARAALLALLIAVLRGHDAAPPGGAVSPGIARARAWMLARLDQPDGFGVVEAAAVAGLGVSRFHERFAAEVGLTPAAWRLRHRVERAKRRLEATDEPITAIALGTGFGTSQSFATAFKKVTGLTPRAWRAAGARRAARGSPRPAV